MTKKNKPNILQTRRLRLQAIGCGDGRAVLALLTNEEVGKTYMVPAFPDRQSQWRLYERLRQLSLCPERFVYGIYLETQLIGILNEVETGESEIELGYAIHPDHKGNGYATEALRAAIDALLNMGYKAVHAGAFEDNAASIRVMEKCGMRRLPQTEEVEYRGELHRCVMFEVRGKE